MKNKIFTLLLFFFLNHSLSESEKIKPIIEGNINAKIKIVVYETLTCSHCADFHKNVYPKLKDEFLDKVEENTLANIIYELGDEVYSRKIAKNIIHQRSINKIKTTGQLADIVRNAIPKKKSKLDLATKTFQAIRIYLNDEVKELEEGLIAAEKVLRPEGRLAVVSFHSIEDRISKFFLVEFIMSTRSSVKISLFFLRLTTFLAISFEFFSSPKYLNIFSKLFADNFFTIS